MPIPNISTQSIQLLDSKVKFLHKEARLYIWIKKKPVLQGKFYYLKGKPVFLVNIDGNKLWTVYNGYSIANQILEALKCTTLRPTILYKHVEKNLVYMAKPSWFDKYGIQVGYGGHRQIVLPVSRWSFFKEPLDEPFGLPKMDVNEWKKGDPYIDKTINKNEYLKNMSRLKDIFDKVTNRRV
jgi:hypothetical protein